MSLSVKWGWVNLPHELLCILAEGALNFSHSPQVWCMNEPTRPGPPLPFQLHPETLAQWLPVRFQGVAASRRFCLSFPSSLLSLMVPLRAVENQKAGHVRGPSRTGGGKQKPQVIGAVLGPSLLGAKVSEEEQKVSSTLHPTLIRGSQIAIFFLFFFLVVF